MSLDHISWKTNAWKNPTIVASYAQRMNDLAGFNLMKNRVEPAIYEKYAAGPAILDVGVGTGRASLPLARLGFDVTGVDSSEAMLRKCNEFSEAQGTRMTLLLGDVASLQFRDESFDTVMALNTFAHFPHWREILTEWARVTKAGGRMIFDIFSTDHDTAYARAVGRPPEWGIKEFEPSKVTEFYLRLPVDELVSSLHGLGVSLQAIVPYSIFFGSGGYNRFLTGTGVEGYSWNRLLSWIASDRNLYDFLTFLEQDFVSKLTTQSACRYMVVLNKSQNPQSDRAWIERNARYNAELAKGLTLSTMSAFSDIDPGAFKTKLNGFLEHGPNRAALVRILFANLSWNWPIAMEEFFQEPHLSAIGAIYERGRLESEVVKMLQRFPRSAVAQEALSYKGIPIGPTMEYDGITQVLDKAYHAFGDSK